MLQQKYHIHFPVSANVRPGQKDVREGEFPEAQDYQDGNKEDTEEKKKKIK